MKHLFKQYLLILNLTLLAAVGMYFVASTLLLFDASKLWLFIQVILLIVVLFLTLDWLVFQHFFKPILAWLKAEANGEAATEDVLRDAVRGVIAYPYQTAIYFFLAWALGVSIVYFLTRGLDIIGQGSGGIIGVAVVMCAGAIIPLFFFFSRLNLQPLRHRLAEQTKGLQEVQPGLYVNLQRKMIFAMITLAVFAVLFGGIFSFNRAQGLLKKYFVSQLNQTLFLANLYVNELDPKLDAEGFRSKIEKLNMGAGYIYTVDKSTRTPVNNLESYDLATLLGEKPLFRPDRMLVQNPGLNTRLVIGGVFDLDEVIRDVRDFFMYLIVLGIICLGIAGLFAYFFSNEFLDAFRTILSPIQRIAGGDLTSEINIVSEDEMGRLAVWLKQMNGSLYGVTTKINSTAHVILELTRKLSENNQSTNASFETITRSSNEVADVVGRQSEEVESASVIMNHLRVSYEQVAKEANGTAQASERAVKSADAGGQAVKAIREQMAQIERMVKDTRSALHMLHTKSAEIGTVVALIGKISKNTTTLALNASIEAARAGESGRGFAVVASEVNKLADASAVAASQIAKIVAEIQGETQRVVTAIDAGNREVERGQELVVQTDASFTQILGTIQEMTSLSSSIAKATEEQVQSTNEVMEMIAGVADLFRQSSQSTRKVAAMSENQKSVLSEATSMVQKMNGLVAELRQLIDHYKLKT